MARIFKKNDPKVIRAWTFYDWANSVYSLVISTAVFPLYYAGITNDKVISFLGIEWEHPDTLYSYTLSFSFLVVVAFGVFLSNGAPISLSLFILFTDAFGKT